MEIELERTYLVKRTPDELKSLKPVEIWDVYFPKEHSHPVLRMRKRGEKHELTKKTCLNENDSSEQKEDTIFLTEAEFKALTKAHGKNLHKNRYTYKQDNVTIEVDVYLDDLAGLVVTDFEFESREDKDVFMMPNWCLVEVTQDEALAGGKLAGKKYSDILEVLEKYGYNMIKKYE